MGIEIAGTIYAHDESSDGPASIVDIAAVVAVWAEVSDPEAIVESGMWGPIGRRAARLTTERLDLGPGDHWAWTATLEHSDLDDPTVTWRVDVEAVEHPHDEDTEVGIALSRVTLDPRVRLLDTGPPATPGLFRQLVAADGISCTDGETVLWAESRRTTTDSLPLLAELVTSESRRLPVIALTCEPGSSSPRSRLDALGYELAGMAHVWIIPPDCTHLLGELLPAPRLGVADGEARIWWPGVSELSNPSDHRLSAQSHAGTAGAIRSLVQRVATDRFRFPTEVGEIRRVLRERERDALMEQLTELEEAVTAPSPASAGPAAHGPTIELARFKQRIDDLMEDRDHALGDVIRLETQVQQLRAANTTLANDLEILRHRLSEDGQAALPDEVDLTREKEFLLKLQDVWAREVCPTPDDQEHYPLLDVRLHKAFLDSLEAFLVPSANVSPKALMRTCAEVACDRFNVRERHEVRRSRGGNAAQVVRKSDGAAAWRCYVENSKGGAPRLHYWRLNAPGEERDMIELVMVVSHDEFNIPE